MRPIPKTFAGGIVVGLVVGIVAGMLFSVGFIIYARHKLLKQAEATAAARGGAPPNMTLPEPYLISPDKPLAFDFGLPLRTPDGEPFDLAALRGKTVVVNMWATWCKPCIAELPSLDALAARFRNDPDVAFLLISRDVPQNLRSYLGRHKRPAIPIAVLPPGTDIPGAGAIVPETFIIAPSGEVKALHRGAANWDDPTVVRLLTGLAGRHPPEG